MRGNQKNFIAKIALERIYRLFELAEKNSAKHSERSTRYVELAWKISLRNKVKIPAEFKSKFCRKCKCYFCEKNFEKKNEGKLMVLKCAACGYERKLPAK